MTFRTTPRIGTILVLVGRFLIGTAAFAQTTPFGRLDFLKARDTSFALFANTSASSQPGKNYPNELVLLTGLPSNPTIAARVDLLGQVQLCGGCGGIRNVAMSPDGDTALVSSEPSDFQPPVQRTVSSLFLLRNVRAFARTKNPADLQIRKFSATDFPQLDNVSGVAFGPDGRWAVVNTRGPGYIDLSYTTLGGTVVVITGLPDNPVFSAPFTVPMHSLGNIDLSLDGGTLLLNDTIDVSGGTLKSNQVIVRGVRPGGPPPRVVAIATTARKALTSNGPTTVSDATLTLDGRFVIAPISQVYDFDAQQMPIGVNEIAILGPVRNGRLEPARVLSAADGVGGGPNQAGVSPDGDSALVVNQLDAGGANLLTGLSSSDPSKFKIKPLPFPAFGPPFPLGPSGPPILAPHGQPIYTADGETALVVNLITPPFVGSPMVPSVSVLTGFQSGSIRVAANLSDATFNPTGNKQQIATVPAGLFDYINLYVPQFVLTGPGRADLVTKLNAVLTAADRGDPNGAIVDGLVGLIRDVNGLVRSGDMDGRQAAVMGSLAIAGIQAVIGHAENVSTAGSNPEAVAPDSIASLYGSGFSASQASAGSGVLPTTLAGTSVTIMDTAGAERPAPLYYVSPSQIDYLIPAGTAPGKAFAFVKSGSQTTGAAILDVEQVAPGLFTVAGGNLAAALVQRVKGDGTQTVEAVTAPIDLGPATDQVFLTLFGTGIRGRSANPAVTATAGGQALTVSYAGPQNGFAGLDQVNVLLPRGLAGSGSVEIALAVDGWDANKVTITVR